MENSSFKKELKDLMKSRLKGIVSESVEKYGAELNQLVEQATDAVASTVLDEAKIEEIANATKKGATYVATVTLIKQVAQDAVKEAKPLLNEISQTFSKIVAEAASEVIMELIAERITK